MPGEPFLTIDQNYLYRGQRKTLLAFDKENVSVEAVKVNRNVYAARQRESL